MNELSPQARRLLRLARPCDEASTETLRRVESSLVTRLASGAAVVTVSTAAAKAAATVASTLPWLKIMSSIGLVVTAAGAGWWGAHALSTRVLQRHAVAPTSSSTPMVPHRGSASVAPVAAAQDAERGPKAELRTVELGAKVSRSRTLRVSAASSSTQTSKSEDPLRAEIRGLRIAQQALRSGDGARVLALLNEQETAYSNGALQEERGAAKVLALCQTGQGDEARALAERFEQRWPKSPLVARLRNSCWKP